MLNKIINWAQKEDVVRALILTGSRASNNTPDFLADYDISLFVTDPNPYLTDNSWIHTFGKVWIKIADKICVPGQKEYHTRLVIFENGIKIDFAFFTTEILNNIETLGDLVSRFSRACKVLLDKDGLTKILSVSGLKTHPINKPSQKEFETVIEEFFFEVYHVAKYLYRNELWLVKFRDWSTKEFLLRMIEWNWKSQNGWDFDTHYQGKNMQSWCDKEIWEALNKCFAHFDAKDSWQALIKTIELFRRVAAQTAKKLGYKYSEDIDKNITGFIQKIRNKEA